MIHFFPKKTEPHVHAFEECSLLLELPFRLAYKDSKVCHRLHHLQCGRLLISTVDWHYRQLQGEILRNIRSNCPCVSESQGLS